MNVFSTSELVKDLCAILLLASTSTAFHNNQSFVTGNSSNSTGTASNPTFLNIKQSSLNSGFSKSTISTTTSTALHAKQSSLINSPSNSTITAATYPYVNQSSLTSNSLNSTRSVDPSDFINCSYWDGNSPPVPAASASLFMSFEEYWCSRDYDETDINNEDYFDNNQHYVPAFYGLEASVKSYCLSFEAADYSNYMRSYIATQYSHSIFTVPYDTTATYPASVGSLFYTPSWTPKITPPCCDTFCNIGAASAQMLYWPTPAPVPGITTVVGPDGFTYTSPSVYVVYMGISATNDCGETLGSTTASTTMSYHETDISTFVGSWDEYRTLDFGELYPNCTTNSPSTRNDAWCNSATGLSQISECFPLSAATASIWSQQHCYPQLPYPSNLQAINPAWANCADSNLVDDRHGIYDPPRTLAPAPVLAPTPTKDKSVPSSAAPVPRPVQPGPPITAPPRVPSSVNLPENDQQNGNTALPKDSAIADPPYSQTSTSDDLQPDSDDFPGIPSSTVDPANGPVQSTGGTQKGIVGPAKTSMDGDTGSGNGVLDVNPGSAGGPAAAQVATTIDGHIVQAVSSSPGVFLVDGELLTVGGSPVTVSGTPLALNSNNYLVFGTSTLQDPVPTPASPQVSYFTVGSETLTFSSGLLMAAGKTLEADQSGITVDGTSVSLAQSALQIGASTIALDPPASLSSPTVTTVAGRPITILPTAVFIADTTLTSNAPGITILGTPISFGSNGLIIGTSTISLSIPTSNSVATIAGQAVNLALGGVSIAGTTLKIDDPAITISGTPVSLGVSGLILGTSTVPLPAPSSGSVITLAGQAATLYPALGQLAIAGTTVRIGGPAVTISGTPIALESSVLIAGTSTLPFPGIGPFSTQGIGDFIFAGLNGGLTTTPIAPSSTGSSNQTQKNSTGLAGVTEPFLGSASRVKTRGSTLGAVLLLAIFQREVLRI